MTTTNTTDLLLATIRTVGEAMIMKFDEKVAAYDALVADGLATREEAGRSYWVYKAVDAARREDLQSDALKAALAWDLR